MLTERQQEIIEVSLDLISQNGIQGLTIKNLSKKIGISEPAIYRHFDSKVDILIAILDFFTKSTQQIFEKELKNTDSAIDKIEHLYSKHFQFLSAKPSMATVLFSEEIFKNEPILITKIQTVINEKDTILISILEEGQQKGEINQKVEVKYLATIIMGTLRLFVKKWQFSDFSYNLLKEGNKLFETIKLLIIK